MSLSLSASLVLLACALGSYAARKLLPRVAFLHNAAGAFAMSALSAVAMAITGVVQAQGVHAAAIEQAAIGALLSLLASSNPSALQPQAKLSIPDGSSARVFLPLVFLAAGMTLSSCGILKPLPEPTPAQYDAALKSCLEAAGASQGLAVGEQLLACFEQPSETVAQYEQCAEQDSGALAIDVLSVVAQCAVDSWLDFNPVPANTAPKPAVLAAREVRVHFLHAMVGR